MYLSPSIFGWLYLGYLLYSPVSVIISVLRIIYSFDLIKNVLLNMHTGSIYKTDFCLYPFVESLNDRRRNRPSSTSVISVRTIENCRWQGTASLQFLIRRSSSSCLTLHRSRRVVTDKKRRFYVYVCTLILVPGFLLSGYCPIALNYITLWSLSECPSASIFTRWICYQRTSAFAS